MAVKTQRASDPIPITTAQREGIEARLDTIGYSIARFERNVKPERVNAVTTLVDVQEQLQLMPKENDGLLDIRIPQLSRIATAHLHMRETMLQPNSTELDAEKEGQLRVATDSLVAPTRSFQVLQLMDVFYDNRPIYSEAIRRAQIISRLLALETAFKEQ